MTDVSAVIFFSSTVGTRRFLRGGKFGLIFNVQMIYNLYYLRLHMKRRHHDVIHFWMDRSWLTVYRWRFFPVKPHFEALISIRLVKIRGSIHSETRKRFGKEALYFYGCTMMDGYKKVREEKGAFKADNFYYKNLEMVNHKNAQTARKFRNMYFKILME